MEKFSFKSTAEIEIPKNPIDRVIGQEIAVKFAKISAIQKRHLLLVGPPGTGKSMIARAMAFLLPKPEYEISVIENPEKAERPIIHICSRKDAGINEEVEKTVGKIIPKEEIPSFVSERLGFRCRRCGALSSADIPICPHCGADKFKMRTTPFDDMLAVRSMKKQDRVPALWKLPNGKEQTVIFERYGDKIRMLTTKDVQMLESLEAQKKRRVIVSLDRSTFVQATGASETELLGDVRHDPYGSHPEIGIPTYKRVIAGAVHDAHEGILFVDEIATLSELQRHILTAMQDKHFPITGRNPTSAGASVRVDNVPCDFIFVAASNIQQMEEIIPPLRSRIRGNGYEILVNTTMPITPQNTLKMYQFIAQEIINDGKIPHANKSAVDELIKFSIKAAKEVDNTTGYSLRFRPLAGIIKLSGDFSIFDDSSEIKKEHVVDAEKYAKSIEEQLTERHGSLYKAQFSDYGRKQKRSDVGSI
ncbi:ATP-binding protein [Candidatus Micrarchaeota archaeon]|nr:ATP-binding protein [Candidatus Micrarchaeota archaeon]